MPTRGLGLAAGTSEKGGYSEEEVEERYHGEAGPTVSGGGRIRRRPAMAGATADGGTEASPGRGSREGVRVRAGPAQRAYDRCVCVFGFDPIR
jgi:hypothetical protein